MLLAGVGVVWVLVLLAVVQMIGLGVPAGRQVGGQRGVDEPGDGCGVRGWGSTAG